jgi:signal peptidase II
VPVLGEFFRLTYTHNPGAAFGINIGEHSRVFFLILSLVALIVLGVIYRATPAADRLRLLALALVSAGAVGNIIDRLRFEAGVVDFLDVGLGSHRWPIFNVADMAVSIGAVLLLISFYFEDRDGGESEPVGD